jgi:hypothetical protein
MDIFKREPSKALLPWFLIVSIAALPNCSRPVTTLEPTSNKNSGPTANINANPPQSGKDEDKTFADFFVREESLSSNEYEVVKTKKWIRDDYLKQRFLESCAVLKRKGRVVTTFEGIIQGGDAAIDFGLAPLLSSDSKQFVVSQTRPRGGRHWVVDPVDGKILFDSVKYEVGREDVWIRDVDKDGVSEIILELPAFYMFEDLSPSVTPLPLIIFRYDPKTRVYSPANAHFGFGLEGMEDAIAHLDPTATPVSIGGGRYLSPRLDILSRYLFAGKRREGWAFFDQYYLLPDKQKMKMKIKAVLAKQPVYRWIYTESERYDKKS